MAKKIGDLRRRPVVPPPPESGQRRDGVLPLAVGSVSMKLTDFEKKQLAKLGWKEGDPLPADLAEDIQRALEEASTPTAPVPMSTPRTKIPEAVDIGSLPPEKQQQLRDSMQAAKQQAQLFRERKEASLAQAGPGVNEAIDTAMAAGQQGGEGLTIVNDLSSSIGGSAQEAQPAQPGPESIPTTEDQAGAAPELQNCPHCNWNLNLKDDLPVSDQDKLNYMISVEGGQRFRKTLSLLNGRLVVTFRSLTSRESDMATRQIVVDGQKDLKDQLADSTDTYWRNLMTYRLVMGIESLWSRETGQLEVDEIGNMQIDPADMPFPNTRLNVALPAVTEAVMPTETLRRILGSAYHRFQLLVEKLEVMAPDPNFWPAIEGQP